MVARTSLIGTFTNGDAWDEAAIDSLPAGWLGYIERDTDVTGATSLADLSSMAVTVNLNGSRRIRVRGRAGGPTVTNTDTAGELHLREGSTTLDFVRWNSQFTLSYNPSVYVEAILTPVAGSHTYKLSIARATGTGTVGIAAEGSRKIFLIVEDVGPA